MQRIHESEERSGHTPPPPYALVDNLTGNNNQTQPQQYHSQNPYPAAVIPSEADFRLAQKLQDEEYAQWVETNQDSTQPQCESSNSCHNPSAPPLPSIPENYQYNHHLSYQNNSSHCHHHPNQSQYPIIYASPNQPSLPYAQTTPYVTNGVGESCNRGENTTAYYGSLNQGYYNSTNPHPHPHPPHHHHHPFYNAPYQNYQQVPHQHIPYRSVEGEEDNSLSCLTGFGLASLLCYCCSFFDD